MRTWNTPRCISTCRNAISMLRRTRSIRSRLLIRAFHESGRTTTRHDTATLGGGRYHPQGRKSIHRTLCGLVGVGTAKGPPGHRALPYGRARWAPRSMRSLRSSGHLLQLLPQPSLSEVPDQRTGEVAVRPATGTLAGMLLPRGFQCAACAGAVDLAKQETPLRPIVGCQRCNAAGSRCRSRPSRCGDRLPQYSPYLGTDLAAPPTYPLCRTGWRPVARPLAVDSLATPLLLAGESTEPRVSREVRRRVAAGLPPETNRLPRRFAAPG